MKKLGKFLSVLGIALLGGFFGAWAGASGTNKAWRRILIPALITVTALYKLRNWLCIMLMCIAGFLSMGYGVPSPTDAGSDLGRFWYEIFNGNLTLTNIFTRGTVGLLVVLGLIWIPLIKHNWLVYGLCGVGIVLAYALISWRDFGGFYCQNKYLLWVDVITYGTLAGLAEVMVHF